MGSITAPRDIGESRVFIVQEDPKKNLLGASEFGQLQEPIFPAEKVVIFRSAPMVKEMKRQLHDYSDDDYILAVGDWVLVGIAIAVAARINGGIVNVLKWDREERQYYNVEVDMNA